MLPDKLLIYDDNENKVNLTQPPLYYYLLNMLHRLDMQWEILPSNKKGQIYGHQYALDAHSDYEFIWRLDDDEIAMPNTLEILYKTIIKNEKIGAVGGIVAQPNITEKMPIDASNKIEDIYKGINEQWFYNKGDDEIKEVDHLYSSFLYRRSAAIEIGGYDMRLSKVGHREETILTYGMKHAGYKNILNKNAVTWHFRMPDGGIRGEKEKFLWQADERVFELNMKDWEVDISLGKVIVLENGVGDHYMFKMLLPELIEKYDKVTIAASNPGVFWDYRDKVNMIGMDQARLTLGDIEKFNIYKWCTENKWKGHMLNAYRRMYQI